MVLNLDPRFKPLRGTEVSFESFVFNGGEPHIRIKEFDNKESVHVTHRINSFNDLGLLCIAVDALKRMDVKNIHAVIPYFPAARQDRVMVTGESLSVKVYADIVNGLKLKSVSIFDPHSDVTPALLNNCITIQNTQFISKVTELIPSDFILISPDAGASKKIFKLASQLGISNILECGKKRNLETGQLSGFSVPVEDLNNKSCLIVDDICDGGGTFLGLATELKKKNSGDLFLAVSHGIFSKGYDSLSGLFKETFTTDSFKNIESPQVTQLALRQILNNLS
jgi:ribose-phosphate pyrophosphokinase